jgi:hypothetical protein
MIPSWKEQLAGLLATLKQFVAPESMQASGLRHEAKFGWVRKFVSGARLTSVALAGHAFSLEYFSG